MSDRISELMQIGSRLAVCRQNKNLTQEALAGKLGVTPQALSKWERGISLPDVSMLADIARVLEISVDWLLGVEQQSGRNADDDMQREIGNNLRNSLEPVELIFGKQLIQLFLDNRFSDKIFGLRKLLSTRGVLMPIVRLRDEMMLGEREFMVLGYQNVLYSETVEVVDENTLDYMIQKLGDCVWEKYYEIIDPDIVKGLVDNLKIRYPALIEGVVPERISYNLLTEVLRNHLKRKNGALYLPKVIEITDNALREKPDATAGELAVKVAAVLERGDNFWVMMGRRRELDK